MKEIRYTLGDSPLWHSLYVDIVLESEVKNDLIFAYLITQELRRMGIRESAKKFVVLDENKKVIAHSEDISEPIKLTFTNNENEKS